MPMKLSALWGLRSSSWKMKGPLCGIPGWNVQFGQLRAQSFQGTQPLLSHTCALLGPLVLESSSGQRLLLNSLKESLAGFLSVKCALRQILQGWSFHSSEGHFVF